MSKVDLAFKPDVAPQPQLAQASLAIVNGRALRDLINLDAAILLVRQAMRELSAGHIDAPERWTMPASEHGVLALMPGAMPGRNRFGIKVLSLFEAMVGGMDLPGHQGLMLLFDAENGRPLSVIDADSLTGLRTAAASAVATDLLARGDSTTLAMIGCGEQARWHVRALRRVRPIHELRVWGRSSINTHAFAVDMEAEGVRVTVYPTPRETIEGADIVCTVTRSDEPLIFGDWLSPGQHLNLVGSSTNKSREVDEVAVARGRFIVDSRSHALSQGGELRAAIAAGVVSPDYIHAEIGEVLSGEMPGREDPEMITIYKSLGHVAQDLAVAIAVHENAAQSPHTVWAAW